MEKPPLDDIVIPSKSPKSVKNLKSNLTECIACKRKLEVGSSLCSRCGSFQVAWKNHLRYWSTTVSLFVFVTTALTYLISTVPEVWKMFTWKDRVEVLDVMFPGSIVLNNIGDGDVIVREFHWVGTVQDMEHGKTSGETIPINKKLSFDQKVETIELKHGRFHKMGFIGSYMTNEEVPRERRLKLWEAARSPTDKCWSLKIKLKKSQSMEEGEVGTGRPIWSVPLDGTISYYSIHTREILQEKVPLLGFVVKNTENGC